jgi:CDP-glucose 4,6-dehydratase
MGTINVLESIRSLNKNCTGIFITTDKVYKNNEWVFGYRENDELGGYDPYSSSKAACEIAISSWRSSFDLYQSNNNSNFSIASARAGNVIGGGDWSENRIIPDVVRCLINNEKILIRNPKSTRPWQHVLEPLSGYLILAEKLNKEKNTYSTAFNFGPFIESNKTVKELVDECLKYWKGDYYFERNVNSPHEAGVLNLSIEKAIKSLEWNPKWDFSKSIELTINWYKDVFQDNKSAIDCSLGNLKEYTNDT